MKKPLIPVDEVLRLEALAGLEIMDTSAEDVFDEITELICKLLDVPVAAISLVEKERQWFKSSKGLAVTETSKDISFCAHAVYDKQLLVVPDATSDERFSDNPLVTGDFGLRFYIGEPIIDENGFALGALCAIDNKPRFLSDEQIQSLRLLAKTVYNQLNLRKNIIELQRDNLRVARLHTVTKSFLDKSIYEVADVDIIPNGIWYLIKNRPVQNVNVENFVIQEKFDQALELKEPVVFLVDQVEGQESFQIRVTIDLVQKGRSGKNVFSLRAELAA